MSRYDKRDPTRAEMLLTRAIHHLWAQRAGNRGTGVRRIDSEASEAALETLFQAKREVKEAEAAVRAEAFHSRKHKFVPSQDSDV